MTPREQWDRAKIKLRSLSGFRFSDHPTQLKWNRDCEAMWRRKNPRKKKCPGHALATADPEIEAEFQKRKLIASRQMEGYLAARERWNNELDAAAEQLPVLPGTEWMKHDSVSEGSYRTMGWGASKYASESAQSKVDQFVFQGLEAEVRPVFHKFDRPCTPMGGGCASSGYTEFEVWVKADVENIDITKRKPGITLKEWIRRCWKRGVNPRVYNPFLPTGLEEKIGLDYFGNEIQPDQIGSEYSHAS